MIENSNDIILRTVDCPVREVRVDRHDDGVLMSASGIVDEVGKRHTEEISDMQPDYGPTLWQRTVQIGRAESKRGFRYASANDMIARRAAVAKELDRGAI